MTEWFKTFWGNHGERLIFMGLALALAGVMYYLDLQKEANVIIIGSATLCFNKARGTNGQTKEK